MRTVCQPIKSTCRKADLVGMAVHRVFLIRKLQGNGKIMAQRRMFSLKIIDTDLFVDMPQSARLLYYDLSMRADDDGFVGSPKKIMRMTGASDDDMKVLSAKKFIIPFESGICVIKHWKIHNYIQKDRYQETTYLEEKEQLKEKKNGSYTIKNSMDTKCIQDGYSGKVRLGKDRVDNNNSEQGSQNENHSKIVEVIDLFKEVNPTAYSRWYGNKTQRQAIEDLLKSKGEEIVKSTVEVLPKVKGRQYFPTITTPCQLRDKWSSLETAFMRLKENNKPKEQIF